jgi:FkbM family methyltransferase
MNNFRKALERKLFLSLYNNYAVDNYDEYRFGGLTKEVEQNSDPLLKIKRIIKKAIGYKKKKVLNRYADFFIKYEESIKQYYEHLNTNGKQLIVELIAYRLLGYKKVRLSRNNKEYRDAIQTANSLVEPDDTYDPHFLHFILYKCDLKKIGYDIKLYLSSLGVAIDFIIEQYAYKPGDKVIVSVEEEDVVLDLGACWGDTALYFALKAGEKGIVYSFEFIPDNIKIFNMNISLNPELDKRIKLIQNPVSNKSGDIVFFKDNGPSSRIEFKPFEGQTGFVTTISIDDFVKNNSITKVDFIKMDIEGSEPVALEGAIETIKRFKPKLAIAIYHSLDDFVNIPGWIIGLKLGYKIYLDHYTIHSEETVLFAKVEE